MINWADFSYTLAISCSIATGNSTVSRVVPVTAKSF